jgi:heterogeneous nuclear ribonucleoprotein L
MGGMGGPAPGLPQQGAVLMVYSLNKDRMNADKLFNLLCLYGNVVRIKFLKTKEGCAMVQMGDALAVERAIGNLNNTTFFGNKMQLGYSKQAFLADMQTPFDLPDGTPSFKDYMGNKNNRFINPEQASKNRIQPPSKILHFFNTPPTITEETMKEIFTEEGVTPPKAVKVFQTKTERSSRGLLEFDELEESMEGLISCNHSRIPNPSGTHFPFIMKLCFSYSRSLQHKSDRAEKKEDEDEEKW